MDLTPEEEAWLNGAGGPALKRAMEIVVALGRIYGAKRLIPIASVQIAGVSYRNIGAAGLRFLQRWAAEGAQVRVPTTLNPAAMDLKGWRQLGFTPEFAARQQQVIEAFAAMGVGQGRPLPTCTPYLVGNVPEPGDSVAWAESSAVAYANSVLAARTNREGGPGALAAALTGRTAAYGMHLDENRQATLRVEVRVPLPTVADFSALGALVGQVAGNRIPYFYGLPVAFGELLWREKLKALGAALAATGAVALYHVDGVTPEAIMQPMLAPEHERLVVDDLTPAYTAFNTARDSVDLVWMGCPHASLAEIREVATWLTGRRVRVPLWITCARPVRDEATRLGLTTRLEAAGVRLVADACVAIAPVHDLGVRAVATSSAKGAYYLANLASIPVHFGSLERCVRAALTGHWES